MWVTINTNPSFYLLCLIPLCLFLLYLFPLYLFPRLVTRLLYLIPVLCYNWFRYAQLCYTWFLFYWNLVIPLSIIPNSVIPDSTFACYNLFRYARFPAPIKRLLFFGISWLIYGLIPPIEAVPLPSHSNSMHAKACRAACPKQRHRGRHNERAGMEEVFHFQYFASHAHSSFRCF